MHANRLPKTNEMAGMVRYLWILNAEILIQCDAHQNEAAQQHIS